MSGSILSRFGCSLVITTLLAASPAAISAQPASRPLSGTSWELLAVQSMDDSQGTLKIPNPELFTASFADDGQVSFQLDCNRGTASWEVKPSAEPASGTLSFGPIAATRALCAPPNIDERVARELGMVRGYLLKNHRLYMTLMADGGIYEWREKNSQTPAAVGQVLGKPLDTREVEELRYTILKALTDRYARQKNITVSQSEVDAYLRDMRAKLKLDPATETREDREARNSIARAFIQQWKVNGMLYRQYGGRIIYQQGGPEPLDAYRKFLEENQARGDFRIDDAALDESFWRYYRTDTLHSFYKSGSREAKRALSVPPWRAR